ncbi:hypothetical protein IVB56_09445 [Bradyrhizobium sp. CW7]|uniref:hypothetical protein n=1 Tax=Bradyrhizobium sp. CW7 TaxID=2782688 RepID=UPI001FF73EDB|nr:hypothetical protein [Bradyrhizobium sp. CW7]MCK1351331.1 hypothetical protein [Bradyrhizobium sp. CW7]
MASDVTDFIHRRGMRAKDLSNFACKHQWYRLRVAFARDAELHRDAKRDNALRASDEAQSCITLQLVMFDASIARAVAETSADDADEEE